MIKSTLLLGCLTALIILSTGCDAQFDVKGKVVEWVDAPDNEKGSIYIINVSMTQSGKVFINESPPEGYSMQPVATANISFFYEWRGKYEPIRGGYPTPSKNTLTSDFQGNFKEFWVVGPGEYNMKIVVQKDGYYSVERTFLFNGGDPGNFDFTVILVHKP
jgi:hypothetical protein